MRAVAEPTGFSHLFNIGEGAGKPAIRIPEPDAANTWHIRDTTFVRQRDDLARDRGMAPFAILRAHIACLLAFASDKRIDQARLACS